MAKTAVFQSTITGATPDDLFAFHRSPGAFQALNMPPIIPQILQDDRSSLTAGVLKFRLWIGPIPVSWTALHEPGPIPTSFKDLQIKGPMAEWVHEHLFETIPGGVMLTDRIRLAHKPGWRGWLTRLLFDGLPLRILFLYRHWRTRRAVQKKN